MQQCAGLVDQRRDNSIRFLNELPKQLNSVGFIGNQERALDFHDALKCLSCCSNVNLEITLQPPAQPGEGVEILPKSPKSVVKRSHFINRLKIILFTPMPWIGSRGKNLQYKPISARGT